jgi:DNA-binding NtrC family response regulator
MKNARVLVVDDESDIRTELALLLHERGYEVQTAADGEKAVPKLLEFDPDLLLTDLRMTGMDGLELMARARENDPDRGVVLMTGFAGIETAVSAMRSGAADYVQKPLDVEELFEIVERVIERRQLRVQMRTPHERTIEDGTPERMLGGSPEMQQVQELIRQVAPSRASALITGESGTGKELVATAIHRQSLRARGPFVKLNCAALAETLLESELFGHERGAFTGALNRRLGRFEQADGGTLFLDEIGEISASLQVKLLRFLQEQEFERVGGNETIKVDVRILAATNRDLQREVAEKRFREDLYYRLNVISIELPPLRARRTDIVQLAMYFLQRFGAKNDRPVTGFSDEALEALLRHTWPGNVRELENAIERAVVVSRGELIRCSDLPPALVAPARTEKPALPGSTLADIERYSILKTLEHTGGCKARAARILGISHRKIQYKLHEYGRSEPDDVSS